MDQQQGQVNHTLNELNDKYRDLVSRIKNDRNDTLLQQTVSAIIPGRGDQEVKVTINIVEQQVENILNIYKYKNSLDSDAQKTVNNLYYSVNKCIDKATELGINGGRRRGTKRRRTKRRGTKRRGTKRRRSSRK